MLVLVHAHLRENLLSVRQFLRATYMWKFEKDITDTALAEDEKNLLGRRVVPPYAVDYLIYIHGDRHVKVLEVVDDD